MSHPMCFADRGLVAAHAVDLLAAAGVVRPPHVAYVCAAKAILSFQHLTGEPPTASMVMAEWPSVPANTVTRMLLLAPSHAVAYVRAVAA